ncbi:uncharacterized protein F4812DRAFT_446713 [Daldinia caldariorum]|uniref:uncharacterized protein n=1 Tax=Daldinia caldariorum TaxID=326644 RepID=UPI002008E414|nr:uncharacterized protein F4812DRAFT_446713 [Daldinia caldariorum]KAI1463370.1 hypothetical protein F4812DRAFT_446713 [Daldinia caldariorum]
MPSVKNPNGPSKNRLIARAAKARKQNQKRLRVAMLNKQGRISKADAQRGARPGLLPNSGVNRSISNKKRRKLERKINYALKRKMEGEGEFEMKDVSAEETAEAAKEEMAVDTDNIS